MKDDYATSHFNVNYHRLKPVASLRVVTNSSEFFALPPLCHPVHRAFRDGSRPLSTSRREKIFRKIGTLDDTEIRKKLTRSEKVLYDAISKILREWEKNVLKEKFDDL
jgi:hypothetical protein